MADLKNRLKASDGPVETPFDGVWAFAHPPTGKVFNYALSEPDSTGRHQIARCTSGPRCRVSIHVHGGLYARYNFAKDHIGDWPQIDHHIRADVTTFISVTAAPDCDQYPCVQDDPVNGATHKIGDIYLRIPDEFLGRPVEAINTGDALGLSFCWPDVHGDLATCAPVTDRIRLHLRPGLGPNLNWYQQTTKRLADIKSGHAGPFRVADTKIDEYRVHSSDMPVYYVFSPNDAENHYLFARCFSRASCRVRVRDYLGLTLQYWIPAKHIESWPKMHEEVKATITSIIVEKR